MGTYKPFFGVQFKVVMFLTMAAAFFIGPVITTQAQHAELEERELLVDLIDGGADLFEAVNEGVIEVFMGGSGSGYIIDKEGYAITNRHVTAGGSHFEIAFWGEGEKSRILDERHLGVLIAEDPSLDLAVIKVEAPYEMFHPVKLGISGDMVAGDVVVTCGSPGGTAGLVNPSNPYEGWLEYFNLNIGVLAEIMSFETVFSFGLGGSSPFDPKLDHYGTALEYVFHVDAAINSGNSGGPCFNAYGEAVGTNTWLFRDTSQAENYGMSVPTDLLKKSVADIIAFGHVRRPWVGIAFHDEYPDSNYDELRLEGRITGAWFDPRPDEMIIKTLNPYSPAYEAGLREGDIIELIGGEKYDYIFDIYSLFLNSRIGDEIEFKIRRGRGRPMAIVVVVGEKKIRYFGADIDINTWYGSQTYHSPITY